MAQTQWRLEEKLEVDGGRTGDITRRLYDTSTGMQRGLIEDEYGWMREIPSS